MKHLLLLLSVSAAFSAGCRNHASRQKEIIIFHAGSLSVPFKEFSDVYEKLNPGIRILREAAGSLVCARKITELKKPCDIIASADDYVINQLLIPGYTSWSIRFATNAIVLAFQEKSKYSSEIDSLNWPDILLRNDVTYGRSDPNSDPCGYRSVMTFQLAEKYYDRPGLARKLMEKNRDFIRPKEVDLVALVESNAVDYMFQYRSVAIQHNLKYIELPDYINLGNPDKKDIYRSVSVDVTGSKPGSTVTIRGDYINYSLSILTQSENKKEAEDFVSFILSEEGRNILLKNGQDPVFPPVSDQMEIVPVPVRKSMGK
jgi:molybdate/tungstate transport system substrate-binding protein